MERTTNVTERYGRRRRRALALSAGTAALLLGFASVAYACTILQGTFTVCNPASTSFSSATCSQRVGLGTQSGLAEFNDTGGDGISVVGSGFDSSPTVYSITYAPAGPSCHAFNPDLTVVKSLLGTNANGSPKTVSGPSFDVGNGTGTYGTVTTPSVAPLLGVFSVCVQDEPQRVDGNAVWVTVL